MENRHHIYIQSGSLLVDDDKWILFCKNENILSKLEWTIQMESFASQNFDLVSDSS